MSKRKRGEENHGADEERHAKIRVQEVDSRNTSAKQVGVGADGGSTAGTSQISNIQQDKIIDRATRKKAKQERRALKKAEKNIHGSITGAVRQDSKGDTKAPAESSRLPGDNTTRSLVERQSSKQKNGRESGAKDANRKKRENSLTLRSTWAMLDPIGGRMLDLDPIFAPDERHLLVAYGTFVAVYSIATSLLIRRLPLQKHDVITGIALDSLNDDTIYISSSCQEISKWDWKEGRKLNAWYVSTRSHILSAACRNLGSEADDVVYTVDKGHANEWSLSAHRLLEIDGKPDANTQTLLKFEDRLKGLQVLHGGKILVTTAGQKLIIGTSNSSAAKHTSQMKYVWRVVECPEWITSFDVRSRPSNRTSKKHLLKGGLLEAIDVALGGLKGTVRLYEDLFHTLLRKENAAKAVSLENVASRNLHWHRNAVMTVKWSLDGNYVISGGQETVLVLWQLETGQKQHLPHLGAAIESIVVSPTGSSYSIRLADNSAMILSTSELRPVFSIAGIQVPIASNTHRTFPHVPSVDAPHEYAAWPRVPQYPACVTFSSTDRLSIAVPPSSMSGSSSFVSLNASYLQTCDISSGHQLSRQALTRTKITTLNMGPESNTIQEPNTTHMQISHDGQWLATIDEWTPPKQDLALVAFDEEVVELEQIARKEIYLKFWLWNSSDQVWELISRFDNPHAFDARLSYASGRVLDLASNPTTTSFSTIGGDGAVKMWVPVARMRRELKVRGKDGESLTSWRCQHTTSTAMSGPTVTETQGANLAYAPDGSFVAAAPLPSSSPSPIYLIDTSTGLIESVHNSLPSGPICKVGITSKYLIILSNHLMSWDLVNNELHYDINLHLPTIPLRSTSISLLAVDHRHETFVFTVPETTKGGKIGTRVAIMDAALPQPLFTTTAPTMITNLLPAISKKGFYAIDANAEIRTFTPQASVPSGLPTAPIDADMLQKGINRIFGPSQASDASSENSRGLLAFSKGTISTDKQPEDEGEGEGEDHDTVVVSAEKLAEVFDTGSASALSLPPVTELFERVARLYGGKR